MIERSDIKKALKKSVRYRKYSKLRIKLDKLLKIKTYKIKKDYFDRELLSNEKFNMAISDAISGDMPFMAGRFGQLEALVLTDYFQIQYGLKKEYDSELVNKLCNNAGVFPKKEETINEFSKAYFDSLKDVDFFVTSGKSCEDFFLPYFMPDAQISAFENLEPYYSSVPWSASLNGKRVLVIHPFENTIKHQFNHREKLFQGTDILPVFDLSIVKAVQTIAGNRDPRFNNWTEALNYMYEEALKIDFDVAIIGCGSYGFPLAAKLKRAGKKTIHLGGPTQILFGIKGTRWETNRHINKYFNEYWIRPFECDTPQNINKVENGCYW